jgi:hypothetical protein
MLATIDILLAVQVVRPAFAPRPADAAPSAPGGAYIAAYGSPHPTVPALTQPNVFVIQDGKVYCYGPQDAGNSTLQRKQTIMVGK